nr:MAG TPA: hypothetical protein [Caudoviricetes sp.]
MFSHLLIFLGRPHIMMLTGPPAPLRWQQRDVTQGGHFFARR